MDQPTTKQPQPNLRRSFMLFGMLVVVAIGWKFVTPLVTKNENEHLNVNASDNANAAAVETVTYSGVDGKNALELLKASHTVVDDNGFVTSIDGHANAAPKYWTLYVNGTMASVGAKDTVTKSTDVITWKLEAFTE